MLTRNYYDTFIVFLQRKEIKKFFKKVKKYKKQVKFQLFSTIYYDNKLYGKEFICHVQSGVLRKTMMEKFILKNE